MKNSFEENFKILCSLLGSDELSIISSIGNPDEIIENEFGTRFLFYNDYKALYTITTEDARAQYVSSPILDAHGTPMNTRDQFYTFEDVCAGDTRKLVQKKWGSPDSEAEYVWSFSGVERKTLSGEKYGIALEFYYDNPDMLKTFEGRLLEVESFYEKFIYLCKYLGAGKDEIIGEFGEPDEIQIDENNKEFLGYERLKAVFTIPNDFKVAEFVAAPSLSKLDSMSGKMFGSYYSIQGVNLGDSRSEILSKLGAPTGEDNYVWAYNNLTGTTRNGYHFELRLLFDTEDPDTLFGFGGMLYDFGKSDMQNKQLKSGCFIATACFGSYDSYEVLVLRSYRDKVLLKTWIGAAFVKSYYIISPPIAKLIADNSTLKRLIRSLFLRPVISLVVKLLDKKGRTEELTDINSLINKKKKL